MDVNTICIIAAILIIVVVFFAMRNRSNASKIMAENTNVVPLMLQKSTQMKVTRLQQATKDDIPNNEKLQKLVTAYKTNQISIQEYNEKLDAMIYRLDVDL